MSGLPAGVSRPLFVAGLTALVTAALPGGAGQPEPSAQLEPLSSVAEPPASASSARPSPAGDFERLLARLAAEESTAARELEAVGPELELTKRRIVARGRAHYRNVRAGLLPAGGGFDELVDHAARVERTRMALERDIATEARLSAEKTELETRLERLRAERAPLEVQREAMERARTALLQADERRAAFARAFETSTRPPDYLAVYGTDVGPTDLDARRGFRSLRGRLPFPIGGRAEVRRVRKLGAEGPGLELSAPAAASVRAVAVGRVVFADRYDDLGQTVILDHGDRYYSLYAQLAVADVRLGEAVAAGARIGALGEDGAQATLYFELRRGPETIDPAPWLGL